MNNQHIQLTPDELSNRKQCIAAIISSIRVSLFTVEVFCLLPAAKFRGVLINAGV